MTVNIMLIVVCIAIISKYATENRGLKQEVREQREKRWKEQNKKSEAYNLVSIQQQEIEELTDKKIEMEIEIEKIKKAYLFHQNAHTELIIEKCSLKETIKNLKIDNEKLKYGITSSVKEEMLIMRPLYVRHMMERGTKGLFV